MRHVTCPHCNRDFVIPNSRFWAIYNAVLSHYHQKQAERDIEFLRRAHPEVHEDEVDDQRGIDKERG